MVTTQALQRWWKTTARVVCCAPAAASFPVTPSEAFVVVAADEMPRTVGRARMERRYRRASGGDDDDGGCAALEAQPLAPIAAASRANCTRRFPSSECWAGRFVGWARKFWEVRLAFFFGGIL